MSKLSFEMALAYMKRGKMVRRASARGIAYRIKGNFFSVWMLVRAGGNERWEYVGMDGCFHSVGILANDWEVVE